MPNEKYESAPFRTRNVRVRPADSSTARYRHPEQSFIAASCGLARVLMPLVVRPTDRREHTYRARVQQPKVLV